MGELVGKVPAEELADVLRQAVCWLVEQLMEARSPSAPGPALASVIRTAGIPFPGAARGHPGRLDRAGHPQAAVWSYFPSLLEPRRCSEQALVAVVQEA